MHWRWIIKLLWECWKILLKFYLNFSITNMAENERQGALQSTISCTLSCIELLTFQFAWVIKLWSWHLQIQFIHILPTHSFYTPISPGTGENLSPCTKGRQSFENEKQSFMTSWLVFLSDWTFFGARSIQFRQILILWMNSEYFWTPGLTLVASKYVDY